jgi:hypothetical protein
MSNLERDYLMPPAKYWETVYKYIQKNVRGLAVDLKNDQIPVAEINALSRGDNAVLGRV